MRIQLLKDASLITELRSLNTSRNSSYGPHSYWREAAFYAALVAGPVCWLALLIAGLPLNGPPSGLLLLKLVLLVPILEEIVFRGGLQSFLINKPVFNKNWFGISVANIVTSLLFAAMHIISQPPVWAALVFFPSLVFGWARDRYNSIIPSIILHAVYNAGFLWLFVAG